MIRYADSPDGGSLHPRRRPNVCHLMEARGIVVLRMFFRHNFWKTTFGSVAQTRNLGIEGDTVSLVSLSEYAGQRHEQC